MGLLDLQTDLKSYKFGVPPASDRPGGGNSGEPYIKKSIDRNTIPQSEDFLLRGGINAPLDAATDVARLAKFFSDLKSPRGALFVAKQNLLSRTGVATQASDIIDWKNAPLNEGVYTPLSTLAQAGIGFTGGHIPKQGAIPFMGVRTYTDAKFQVIGLPSGEGNRLVDFYNEKINKTNLSPNLYSYSGGPNSDLGIGKTNISLVPSEQRTGINNPKIRNSGFFPVPTPPVSPEAMINADPGILGSPNSNFTPETSETGQIAESGFNVFKAPPIITRKGDILFFNDNTVTNKYASIVGISNTPKNLKSGLNVSDDAKSFLIGATSVYNKGTLNSSDRSKILGIGLKEEKNFTTLTQEQLITYVEEKFPGKPNKSNPGSAIQDFRKPLLENAQGKSTIMSLSPSYQPKNKKTIDGPSTSRIRMVSPGQRGNVIDYDAGKRDGANIKMGPVDQINALPIYQSSLGNPESELGNDLVKFRIAAINNQNPSKGDYIHFRAFIDSFSDTYGASWNPQNYMGRAEPFYKYGGFSRNINLSFTVAAQSKEEIMVMYRKLNYLVSNLSPDYTDSGYMAGPLVQLTMGGWCYELPGFISAITLDVPQESPWEIGIPNLDRDSTSVGGITYRNPSVKEMPMICKVTGFAFTPIEKFVPSKQVGENGFYNRKGNQRYIALADGGNASLNNYDKEAPNEYDPEVISIKNSDGKIIGTKVKER